MYKYITCPQCGKRLCRAQLGSKVEIACTSCKQDYLATIDENGVYILLLVIVGDFLKKLMNPYLADNRIWFGADGNNVPSIKRFLLEVKDGTTSSTIWEYEEVGHTDKAKKDLKELLQNLMVAMFIMTL